MKGYELELIYRAINSPEKKYKRKPLLVSYRLIKSAEIVNGVFAKSGNYVITDSRGNLHVISSEKFLDIYTVISPEKAKCKPTTVYAKLYTGSFRIIGHGKHKEYLNPGTMIVKDGSDYSIMDRNAFDAEFEYVAT